MKPLNVYKKRNRKLVFLANLLELALILGLITTTNSSESTTSDRSLNCVSQSPDWTGITLHCNSCLMKLTGGTIYKCTPVNNISVDIEKVFPYFEARLLTSRRSGSYLFSCWPVPNNKKLPGSSAYFYLQQTGNFKLSRHKRETTIQKREAIDLSVPEVYSRWGKPLAVLKIISCVTLIILMSASVVIYLLCGMFYQECLSHMCSEVALLASYVCLLAITVDPQNINKTICACTAVLLHYLFQIVFLSLLLEAFFINRLLIGFCPKNILNGPVSLLIVIFGIPLLITGVSAYCMFDEFSAGKINCWLNVFGKAVPVLIGPAALYASCHLVMLAPVFFLCDVPQHVKRIHFTRAQTAMNTRWASLAILLMTVVVWTTGFLSENHDNNPMLICFCIFSVILASFVPCVRVATEDQVRQRIWAALGPKTAKPSGWPMGLFDGYDEDTKEFQNSKKSIKPTEITKVMAFSAKANNNFMKH